MKRLGIVVACLVMLGLPVLDLRAQVRFGAQGSWGSEDTDFGIGGRIAFGLRQLIPSPGFEGIASFDYFFPQVPSGFDGDYWEINGNLSYTIPNIRGSVAPYVGGGLNIAHASVSGFGASASDTRVGVNLLGGLKFKMPTSGLSPFVELRVELEGGEIVVLSAGLLF